VGKDCKACGLNREDAMDRSRWRKQIGMIDDHNECEWVLWIVLVCLAIIQFVIFLWTS